MKRLGMILIAIAIMVMMGFGNWYGTHYTRNDCVVVSCEENIITVEDTCGYTWEFTADDLKVGDVIDLKMYTNDTDNTIFDDEITDYKLVTD